MIKKHNKFLHDRELAVMRLVWDRGEISDSQVQQELARTDNIDPAGVAEIIRELVQNGVVSGREEERTYVYTPLVSRREVESALLHDLRDRMFSGSPEELVKACVAHEIFSRDQLRHIASTL